MQYISKKDLENKFKEETEEISNFKMFVIILWGIYNIPFILIYIIVNMLIDVIKGRKQ